MKYIVLITLSCFVFACGHEEKKVTATTPPKEKHYELAEVKMGALSSGISLPAQLQPYEIVQLYPKVNGFVKEVLVDRGSVVHKGQVLMRLEAPEVQQQFLAARSKYLQQVALSQASKDAYDRLVATSRIPGTVSAHDLAVARSKAVADSSLSQGELSTCNALQATLDYLVMRAPFDGVITERNVHPGALVGPNQKADDKPLLVLQQEEKLRLVVDIPEEYTGQVSDHQKVEFSVNAIPGKVFNGIINRSAGALSNKYRSETIEVDVPNKDHQLKPGMYAEAHLPVEGNKAALIVPKSAIITSTERKYVVVADDQHLAKWVDVSEGNNHHDSAEVFGNLHAGDRVVLNATDELKQGKVIQ